MVWSSSIAPSHFANQTIEKIKAQRGFPWLCKVSRAHSLASSNTTRMFGATGLYSYNVQKSSRSDELTERVPGQNASRVSLSNPAQIGIRRTPQCSTSAAPRSSWDATYLSSLQAEQQQYIQPRISIHHACCVYPTAMNSASVSCRGTKCFLL